MARRKATNEEFKASFGVNATVPDPYGDGKTVKTPLDKNDGKEEMHKLDDKDSKLDQGDMPSDMGDKDSDKKVHEALISKDGMMNEIMKVLRTAEKDKVREVFSNVISEEETEEDFDEDLSEDFEDEDSDDLTEEDFDLDLDDLDDLEEDYLNEEDDTKVDIHVDGGDAHKDDDDDKDEKDTKDDDDDEDTSAEKKDKDDKDEVKVNMGSEKKEWFDINKDDLILEFDISKLFEDGKFSNKFKNKVRDLFEVALLTNVNANLNKIQERALKAAQDEATSMREDLVLKLDTYLQYVVEGFMKENKLAVQNGLRMQIYESFMQDLKHLFEKHYIDVPDDKVDLVDALSEKLEKTEKELNEEIRRNIEMSSKFEDMRKKVVIEDVTSDMTRANQHKVMTLAENLEFVDEDDFREKLEDLKSAFITEDYEFTKYSSNDEVFENDYTGTLVEQHDNPLMNAVIHNIDRLSRK